MDTNTSGEELLTKIRKPYTITKQRERWTDDEHDRFLEALKLYGRAWQRIEEHIGTKTAVQIRSHAQKFFTKLEKEAEAKGIPVCQALDIEIPPPRPKRKPNTPYPRKPGSINGASSSQVSSAKDAKLVSSASSSHLNQDDNCSGVSTVDKYPSPNKVTPGTLIESEPFLRKASVNNGPTKTSNVDNTVQDVPVDVVNGNMAKGHQFHPPGTVSQDFIFRPMGDRILGHSTSHTNLPASTTSSATTFAPCPSQEDYHLQLSSTFSNLILSTLLQNPAAHAAATFAASAWPYANVSNSGDSSTPMSSPPSVAGIAAATVAAATAWWAAHGLLPVCAPTPITCLPVPTVTAPTLAMDKMETVDNAQLPLEKQNTALQDQNSSDDSVLIANGDKPVDDSNTPPEKKLVDRSSCGSNTPSGSDAETDALDKMEKVEEDVTEADLNELNNRRCKNNNPTIDSWKEVSQGGRIAFQALFARERLPQSFSPPQVTENANGKQMLMAPTFKIQDSCDQESVLMIGVGPPGKSVKTRQTGFKPYKRCSMESQVGNTNSQSDEKVCKRIRLEGEAST